MRYVFLSLLIANLAYLVYAGFMREADRAVPRTVPTASGVDTLYLLSENRHDDNRDERLNRVISNPVLKDESARHDCLAIGPFEDLFSGQAVVDQLLALDIESELRAVDQTTGESDYRVLIPPAPSLQEAFRKLRELKSRDIDSYVITQGADALGISLGVFSSKVAAEAMQALREREGYEVEIVEIPRLSREFWLFSADSPNLDLEPAIWESLVSRQGSLEQKFMACPE
jgi:hypothetical protein